MFSLTKRIFPILLPAVLILILSLVISTKADAITQSSPYSFCSASAKQKIIDEAEFIRGAIRPSGAIAQYTNSKNIEPYFGNTAAWSLARAAQVTNNSTYINDSYAHLKWYAGRMDPQTGYVQYYKEIDGVETPILNSSGSPYDSTDSYAASFIIAALEAYSVEPRPDETIWLKPAIIKALQAMDSTMDTDGATFAKPNTNVKYLMDNSEVYLAYQSAATLLPLLGDNSLTELNLQKAGRLKNLLQTQWWDNMRGSFNKYKLTNYGPSEYSGPYYPDTMAQLWAIAYSISIPSQTTTILDSISEARISSPLPPSEMSPVEAWALSKAGQKDNKINEYITAINGDRSYPYVVSVAGRVIIAISLNELDCPKPATIPNETTQPKLNQSESNPILAPRTEKDDLIILLSILFISTTTILIYTHRKK